MGVLREQVLQPGGDDIPGRPVLERVGGGDGVGLALMREGDPPGDDEPVGFKFLDDLADVTPGLVEPAGYLSLVLALLEEPDDVDLGRVQRPDVLNRRKIIECRLSLCQNATSPESRRGCGDRGTKRACGRGEAKPPPPRREQSHFTPHFTTFYSTFYRGGR